MTVLVIGKDPSIIGRATCRNCSSLLEYTPSDMRDITHSHDYLGGYERGKAITCPCCGKDVIVK